MDASTTAVLATDLGRYLDAVVELTRHRDPQELAAELLRTLRANLPAQQVRLLTLSNDNRVTEFNESNLQNAMVFDPSGPDGDKPRVLSEDADLLACVRTQSPVSSDTVDGRRGVFPIL